MPWKKLHDGNVFSDPTYGKNALWHHPTDPSRGRKKHDGSVLDRALFFNLSYNTEELCKIYIFFNLMMGIYIKYFFPLNS